MDAKQLKYFNKRFKGKQWPVWWEPDGSATVLEVLEYTGRYRQWYACVFKLTSSRTDSGFIELPIPRIEVNRFYQTKRTANRRRE